jgi:hypothetical protein
VFTSTNTANRGSSSIAHLPAHVQKVAWDCLHTKATAQFFQGRAQRFASPRLREEIQAVLRRGEGELSPVANTLWR